MGRKGMMARWGALVLSCALGACGEAASYEDCVQGAAARYYGAAAAFQRDLRDLTVRRNPAFEELATTFMELQLAYQESARAELADLLAHDPERIDVANGISRFINFDWTGEDAARLRAADPSYRALEARLESLKSENSGRRDWPAFRDYFRTELSGTPEYQALTATLEAAMKKTEAALAQCQR